MTHGGKPFVKGFDARRNIEVATANLIRYESGPTHPFWNGGNTKEYFKAHNNYPLQKWSLAVRRRDKYTCRKCGVVKAVRMAAHHIKPMLDFPELALDIENGITFCNPCHLKLHWGIKKGSDLASFLRKMS